MCSRESVKNFVKGVPWNACGTWVANLSLLLAVIVLLTMATFHHGKVSVQYEQHVHREQVMERKLNWLIKQHPSTQPIPDFEDGD